LPFKVGSLRVGYGEAGLIAKSNDMAGKFKHNQCLPFAIDLHSRFKAAGIPSKVIAYSWASGFNSGSHAVVFYEDDGRVYAMDNLSWVPKWIGEKDIFKAAEQFNEGSGIVIGAGIIRE